MTHDYNKVKDDIRAILKNDDYDDGSLGPVFVRLAWHASGTYEKKTRTGGSNGATMRFNPESNDGANAGLEHARAFLEPIKEKNSWISYADLWTLAGCTAIEAMGGPEIPWKAGRTDRDPKNLSAKDVPPNGRLPDAAQGQDHVRQIFYRMGFDDREIVALIGAHAVGRCHADRSGYSGREFWDFEGYYKLLTSIEWRKKQWDGPVQFVDEDDELMMLPADMAIVRDPAFKKIAEEYAADKDVFFKDFAAAFGKLVDLGVPRGNDPGNAPVSPHMIAQKSKL